ncbi:UbiA family prenyltransferase [Pseudarthrobacter sp. J75]|uniref:SCO3242 family prenyltransferase n=1 Tax=unclassified Pseudarthrobacter TaxID=2647000 RepID=UPI002E812453|nr:MULTISPECIES: UbiA family prenyltransferase [unclassified Pseudarthrobacter]MEE2521910.1 UbiA family prenyltransferase [Pseudarthrobacter sp. J47]MEE2528835.1 UbiA family prenyltransferase [Pseudarthrobacter sp. J75]MEE2569968.1 UbiA family prenyltransferase [Pseudarthrobacter sp. J64]
MSRTTSYLELVRAPAVLTVLGDTLAGGSAAGHSLGGRRMALPLASACLYAGGMALNDYADRDVDSRERPERPIPSGRISPRNALTAASVLTVAGLGLSAAGGGRPALAVGLPLAAAIWSYDLLAKNHAISGPLTMGACRALDVLMGAGSGNLRPALGTAGIMGGHTVAVTLLSRGEVNGTTTTTTAGTVAAGTAVLAGAVVAGSGIIGGTGSAGRGQTEFAGVPLAGSAGARLQVLAVLAATAAYAIRCAPAQVKAARQPVAKNALDATKAGIRAMVPLQAALTLRQGNLAAATVLASVDLAGKLLRSRPKSSRISES